MNGACNSKKIWPHPLGPWEGSKCQIFVLMPGSWPRGGTWGHRTCPGDQKQFFEHSHIAYQIDGNDEKNRKQVKFSP